METTPDPEAFAAQLAEGIGHLVTGAREIRVGTALIASALIGRLVESGADQGLAALGRLAARAGTGALKRCSLG